jgi:hypothetical protein
MQLQDITQHIWKKKDESIALELHFIVQKCIANKINANTRIQKLGYVFLNLFNLCLPLHHLSQTFQFINTSPFGECIFLC